MRQLPALLVTLAAVKKDLALPCRGARKLLVTRLCAGHEVEACEVTWLPPDVSDKCQVQSTTDIEVAVFTQHAAQDLHHHKIGTEFYTVVEGRMVIEVEGQSYALTAGDMIVVNPGAVHQVKPDTTEFICRVITVHCAGASDKYLD